jgi:hypothetical protein
VVVLVALFGPLARYQVLYWFILGFTLVAIDWRRRGRTEMKSGFMRSFLRDIRKQPDRAAATRAEAGIRNIGDIGTRALE